MWVTSGKGREAEGESEAGRPENRIRERRTGKLRICFLFRPSRQHFRDTSPRGARETHRRLWELAWFLLMSPTSNGTRILHRADIYIPNHDPTPPSCSEMRAVTGNNPFNIRARTHLPYASKVRSLSMARIQPRSSVVYDGSKIGPTR